MEPRDPKKGLRGAFRFQGVSAPSLASSLIGQGSSGNWYNWVVKGRNVLSTIESDPLIGLGTTDLMGMVIPRTGIELKKRGAIPARETFFREITGTITNTFLAGWLGILAVMLFNGKITNPKGLDMRAWIDSPSLDAYSSVLKDIFKQDKITTADDLRRAFLKNALGRLESTDNVWKLKQYKTYCNGRLPQKELDYLVNCFLGRQKGFESLVFNVEDAVKTKMKLPQYQAEVREAMAAAKEAFMHKLGNQPLTKAQQILLTRARMAARRVTLSNQERILRQLESQRLRLYEKTFLDRVYNFVINKGKLSEEVFFMDRAAKGTPVSSIGVKNIRDHLAKIKRMSALLDHALVGQEAKLNLAAVEKRLFGQLPSKGATNWFQRMLMPNRAEGLIPYLCKSKYWLVLLPVLVAGTLGCYMVVINNWLTKLKTGGNDFPGEKALMSSGGKH